MTGTKVSLAVENGIAWITRDGPERRNALDARAARDRAVEIERARQMWSLARNSKES